ncbi:alcohol dehydrogenase [Verrucomicrobia bacterium LW23]|nr:alcohol dehydrogenase [Verrucomicrobia bacterium LW23]
MSSTASTSLSSPASPAAGRTVVVTGASGRLGAALAQHLAAQGHAVAVHYRSEGSRAAAEAVVERINAMSPPGGRARAFQADLSREADAERLMREVADLLGPPDTLINNAGVYCEKRFHDLTADDFWEGLHSTVGAAFFAIRAALPHLRASGRGRIVSVGDSLCDQPGFAEPAFSYYVGKTGVWMMTKTLAPLEAPHGVTINIVSPGMLGDSLGLQPLREMPAGRFATPADIAAAIDFFLSAAAAYMTGNNLIVAGGFNVAPLQKSILEQAGYVREAESAPTSAARPSDAQESPAP